MLSSWLFITMLHMEWGRGYFQHNLPHIIAGGERDVVACDVVVAVDDCNLVYLPQSIDSILSQVSAVCYTHVVNDGHNLKSFMEVMNPYLSHPNIRVYHNDNTIGPYRIVNKLFDWYETEFIAIQDADDIAVPNRIWRSITTLNTMRAEVFGGAIENFVDWRSRDNKFLQRRLTSMPYQVSGQGMWICGGRSIINGTMALRKATFRDMNGFADIHCSGDVEFAMRATHCGTRVCISREIMILRRLHGSSLTAHPQRWGMFTNRRKEAHDMCRKHKKEADACGENYNPRMHGSLDVYRSALNMRKIWPKG